MLAYIEHLSKRFQLVVAFAQIVCIGCFDLVTGPEISFSIFYLIPIALVAWFTGRRAGYGVSFVAAATWLTADLLTQEHYSYFTIPYWNAAVRMGFFVVMTYALSALRASRIRQEELSHFIVHDLRSPLGIVMTGLYTLQDDMGETITPDQRNVFDLCLSSCNRMLMLINSILDLARLENKQMPLQQTEVSAAQVVQASIDALLLWAKQKDITLVWSASIDTVYADPVITERILMNLLGNAIKFSDMHSQISIQVESWQAHQAAFSVQDSGKGIPQDWIKTAFDKFAQTGQDGTKRGSGLGLSFCRLAVEAQGGRIWIDSVLGQGTVITFTLPLKAPAEGRRSDPGG